jgi:hypothetical protein
MVFKVFSLQENNSLKQYKTKSYQAFTFALKWLNYILKPGLELYT